MRLAPLFLTGLLSACAPSSILPSAEQDLGSTSLCADSYLIALAPDRIASLSWQAGTPLSTATPDMAALPRLWESRELLVQSNLKLLSGPGAPSSDAKQIVLQWGENFDTVRSNLTLIETQFNVDAGPILEQLNSLSDLPQPDQPPKILYLSRAGGSAGPGTFVDAVITKAGGQNINQTPGWHTPSVERLLQYRPDLIVTSFFESDYSGANDRALRHTALRRYIEQHPRLDLPGKLWPCAGPGLIEATRQLNNMLIAL